MESRRYLVFLLSTFYLSLPTTLVSLDRLVGAADGLAQKDKDKERGKSSYTLKSWSGGEDKQAGTGEKGGEARAGVNAAFTLLDKYYAYNKLQLCQ
ncbi:hypothetical protein HDK64DRAFT_278904 [Phyllosticta capitalensis]